MRVLAGIALLALFPFQTSLAVDVHDLFDTFDSTNWLKTNGFSNGSYTDTYWRADHANVVDGKLVLTMDDQPCSTTPADCANKPLASAEVKSAEHFNYGEVEVSMKVAKGPGLISAFFKYTGPHEGNSQDEIDFEILGKDTTKLQVNYFVGGVGGHEHIVDLGFDASEDFHTYRYVHTADYIEWYVDGTLVHAVRDVPLPSRAGRIYMDLWAAALGTGTAQYWAGEYTPDVLPATVEYEYINIIAYPDEPASPPPSLDEQTPKALYEGFNVIDDAWLLSDGWSNGSFAGTGWRSDHVNTDDGKLILRLDEQPCSDTPSECSEKLTASGEIKTKEFFGFGTVEARMKAAKGEGLVSSLFKFTGPWDGNPQDEIDIEILGKDPTKAQFNYFVNGEGGHEVLVDLGFDASQDFHTYGFCHTPNSIEWLVDGVVKHSVSGVDIPAYPGKVMANLWVAQPGTSTADAWAGTYSSSDLPATVMYDYIHITQSVPDAASSYQVKSALSELSIGTTSTSTSTGQLLTQQTDTAAASQRWYMEQEDGFYRVKSLASEECLALQEGSVNRIEEQICIDSTGQQWALVGSGGNFSIVSSLNGRCLAIENNSDVEGAAIVPAVCNGADSQTFVIEGFESINATTPIIESPVYALKNDSGIGYLDVEDGKIGNANVVATPWYGGLSQTWELENVSNNQYRLHAKHSNQCLSLAYGGTQSGINVVQYGCSGSQAMLWEKVPTGNRFEWKSAISGHCLTVNKNTGNATANTCQGLQEQRWSHQLRSQISNAEVPLINVSKGDHLGIAGDSLAAGSAAELQTENGSLGQQWLIEHQQDDLYRLRPQHSNQCLSLAYQGYSAGIPVTQYACTASEAMLWRRVEDDDVFQWVNALNGLCLSAKTSSTGITVADCGTDALQYWSSQPVTPPVAPVSGGMINVESGLNLEVAAASNNWGANIQLGLANSGLNQQWNAESIGGDIYQIKAGHSGMCLSLAYKGSSAGINVVQYSCSSSDAMSWERHDSGTTIEWRNAFSGHCLGSAAGDVVEGANVKAIACTGEAGQQWQLN